MIRELITDSGDTKLNKLWETAEGRGAWHGAVPGVTKRGP